MVKSGNGTGATPYSRQQKEARFQSRIVQCALLNGWRIALEDLDEAKPSLLQRLLAKMFTRGGLQKVRAFLLRRRRPDFALAYHTHDSRGSGKGFPDLVLVHPHEKRIIFAELKRDGEYPTTEQRLWLAALMSVARGCEEVDVFLWKPADWEEIVEELGGVDSRLFV